jgi:hypothetical protein
LAQSGSKNKKFLRPIQMGQDAWESRNWPAILRSEPLALFRTKIGLARLPQYRGGKKILGKLVDGFSGKYRGTDWFAVQTVV